MFVISLCFTLILSSRLYKIPSYQKIEVFISSSYVDNEYFINKINTNESIKKTNIITRSVSSDYYEETLQTIGIFSDIIIMPEKFLASDQNYQSFSCIDYKYFTEYDIDYTSYELILLDNLCYGIVVYDKEKGINVFKDYIVFESDERYVLCVGISTPNVYNNPEPSKPVLNSL
jgi:hypothetical protein